MLRSATCVPLAAFSALPERRGALWRERRSKKDDIRAPVDGFVDTLDRLIREAAWETAQPSLGFQRTANASSSGRLLPRTDVLGRPSVGPCGTMAAMSLRARRAAAAVFMAAVVVTAILGREPTTTDEEDAVDARDLYVSSWTESRERTSLVLPHGPSEDARNVLGDPPRSTVGAPSEHLPNEAVEWWVGVTSEQALTREAIREAFGATWRGADDPPTVFGRGADDGRWTYVLAAETPDDYAELRVAWRIVSLDGEPMTAALAQARTEAVARAAATLGASGSAGSLAPDAVARRASEIEEALERFQGIDIAVRLVAPSGSTYDGRALWDALESLGIEWGDGDFFHWVGPSGDALFSVGTSTPPGYFFPEEAAAGRIQVADLDFGFSLARTAEPLAVLDAMLRAVRWVQGRLGGTLEGGDGEPLDEAAVRADVEASAAAMIAAGFTPGSDAALLVF